MDVVKAFNTELSSLYDVKPPISKAKMTSITKGAIKGIKFYKHIVQSVEKFIQKCRPEYKVPGLYVVDSIVRQSRHQFGADKDVFGPRFLKNLSLTFQQLFKCAEDDRPKIIRVLNLWQKNNVFPMEDIQRLMDMGNPNVSNDWPLDAPAESLKEPPLKSVPTNEESRSSRSKKEINWTGWQGSDHETAPENRPYAEMSTKNLEKFTKAEMTNAIENEVSSSSMFRTKMKQENLPEENTVKFNKKLLDFDYGDEEDEEEIKNDDSHLSNQPNALALSMAQNLLSNPELLRQLQQMQQTIQQTEQAFGSELGFGQAPMKQEEGMYTQDPHATPPGQQPSLPPAYQQPSLPLTTDKDDRVLPHPPLPPQDLDERSLAAIMNSHITMPPASHPDQTDKDDRIIAESPVPARDLDERSLAAILAPLSRGVLPPMPYTEASMMPYQQQPYAQPPLPMMDAAYGPALPHQDKQQRDEDERMMYSMPGEPPLPPQDFDERSSMQVSGEEGGSRSRKERSRSRSGSRTRGRSGRHRSRSRSPRRKRSRSRSPSRKNSSTRTKERERVREKEREREKERDRKRKGLPPIKKNCVSVCTTTLWIGHVPKSCTEMEISSAFGTYGSILSIYMIPPRGCAYVVMDRRQDAYKALQKLKNTKVLQSNSVKMAWAPGKGVKGKEFKDYWEVEAGVSYVPFEKIPEDPAVLDLLEEGGFIDEETLPDNLKALRQQPEDKANNFSAANNQVADPPAPFNSMQQGGPPMVPPPIIPPTTVNLPPMLLHHPMQPQFGLHMSGLIPQAMMMSVPMGIPPPNPMLMVQQQSQNMLGGQTLPMVPSMVPRTVQSIAGALQNLKNVQIPDPVAGSPMVSAAAGDATPTDEDGTSVSSPSSSQKPPATTTTSQAVGNHFNHMMGIHNANRPMLPPSVSSSGSTPIPYPPPNVGYNFPPPGHIRPPNSQFPWMQQKSSGSQFPEPDPRGGMQMFNRPPLPASSNQSPMKDSTDRRPIDMDRSTSPAAHPDKMPQEMVISTDDESSMDREYEIGAGGRFPGSTEFPRMPLGLHRMRGPMPGSGPRFPPQNMPMGAPPFQHNARMGGPRVMGMHPIEFSSQRGGPRMPGGPPQGPTRPPNEGRDWYPRDFERDTQFREERGRGSWTTADNAEADTRQIPGERGRDFEKRDSRDQQAPNAYVSRDRPAPRDDEDFNIKQKPRPVKKVKSEKELSNDLFRLKFYQRDKKPQLKTELHKELVKRKTEEPKQVQTNKKEDKAATQADAGGERKGHTESQDAINARREREAKKRSRWGRTLSEEREFQEQRKCEIEMKRTEVEMKFQGYEQAAQLLEPIAEDTSSKTDVPSNVDEPGVVSESANPVAESSAQQVDSLPPTDPVPDDMAIESSGSRAISETASNYENAEPAADATNSFPQPNVEENVAEPVTFPSESKSHDFVIGPPEADSLPQSDSNHLEHMEEELTSETVAEVSFKPTIPEVTSTPMMETFAHMLEETHATESCSANESVPSPES